MKPIRTTLVAIGLVLSALFVTAGPAFAAGSDYITDTTLTTVYVKNQWYYSGTMNIFAGTPHTAITQVNWTDSITPAPTGHAEQLCDMTWGQCLPITSVGSGSSSAFNGRPDTDTFQFRFEVLGTGALFPSWNITGKSVSIFYA